MRPLMCLAVALLCCVGKVEAAIDAFGTGANQFAIDFVPISSSTNPTGGFGVVDYDYRIGVYEITNAQWGTFKAELGVPVTGTPLRAYNYVGPYFPGSDIPVNKLSWYEAAQMVNWLNTSTGHQAAYNFSGTQGTSSYALETWSPAEAAGGTNLYRHKDAFYFLPTEDEWVKAAYWNGVTLQDYATKPGDTLSQGDGLSGTGWNYIDGDPVTDPPGPWNVGSGSEELNGTHDMMGNAIEWTESPWSDMLYGAGSERSLRGGYWGYDSFFLHASNRAHHDPSDEGWHFGFRVASAIHPVPEPSTFVMWLIFAALGVAYGCRRRVTTEERRSFACKWEHPKKLSSAIHLAIGVLVSFAFISETAYSQNVGLSASARATQFRDSIAEQYFGPGDDAPESLVVADWQGERCSQAVASPGYVRASTATAASGSSYPAAGAEFANHITFLNNDALRALLDEGQAELELRLNFQASLTTAPVGDSVMEGQFEIEVQSLERSRLSAQQRLLGTSLAQSGAFVGLSEIGGEIVASLPITISPFVLGGLDVQTRVYVNAYRLSSSKTWGRADIAVGFPDVPGSITLPNGTAASDVGIEYSFAATPGLDIPLMTCSTGGGSGNTQDDPVLPNTIVTVSGGRNRMSFRNAGSAHYFDPPATSGFDYTMDSDDLFVAIQDFPVGFQDKFTVSVAGVTLPESFGPGDSVDFAAYLDILGPLLVNGVGVTDFRVEGIKPLVDSTDPVAFPLRLEFSAETVDFSMSPVSVSADINQDGEVDLVDVNLLTAEADLAVGVTIPPANSKFDLTEDGTVNTEDLDQWLADAATFNGYGSPYRKGDANLDGDVDIWAPDGSGDAQLLSENLGMETEAIWGDGDFNGDGDVDVWQFDGSGDAQLLSSNLGTTNDVAVATVPEASTLTLLAIGAVGLLAYESRRRRIA